MSLPAEAPESPSKASNYDLPTPMTPEQAEPRKALTAFLVVVEDDGTAWATDDVAMSLALQRPPTVGDMYRASAEVMRDIQASVTAERTTQYMAAMGAQAAEHQRQDKIARKLAEKGIRVPGR